LKSIQIILPLRNPTTALEKTVRSLSAQANRDFSILLSDNHSTEGIQLIEAAVAELQAAGIAVRRVRPVDELGRVEHWNWAHHQATGDWVKPIFVGDWLEPAYISELRAAMIGNPDCKYVYTAYVVHHGDRPPLVVDKPWMGRYLGPDKMRRIVLCNGMQFGPPSVAAFELTAFVVLGGFPVSLPICADNLLFCTMASRFGALGIPDPLCHFNIHGNRFSTNLSGQRPQTLREVLLYQQMLAYSAWSNRAIFSLPGFLRLLLREIRASRAKQ
jgi:glycosyltransferase involved in cell wall biosynthesis